jgi:hypothetical protein
MSLGCCLKIPVEAAVLAPPLRFELLIFQPAA